MAATQEVTLAADGQSNAITIAKPRQGENQYQNIAVWGTFGSGTVTLQVSYDGGTTYFSITNAAGAVTFTANGATLTSIRGSSVNDASKQVKVRMSLSGATNPSLTMRVIQ